MKKLTAGIFATLLAVVSVDGAYAAIASKGYVDEKVGTVTTALGNKADKTAIADMLTKTEAGTTYATKESIADMETKSNASAKYATKSEVSSLSSEAEKIANRVTTVSDASDNTHYPTAKAVWDVVQAETSDIASSGDLSALTTRVGTLETASANHVVKNEAITGGTHTKITYDAKGLVTAGANLTADDIPTIPNTKVSGLGSLATKSSVATADIASKAVTKEKLADEIVTSLGKADTALQKTTADTTYAVKSLETQVGVVSKENMGTTTATTVVAGVKEAIDAAKAADGKAVAAQGAAEAAQGNVDALEAVVNHETTGLAAAHTAIDALESGKLDKTGTAARATADASGNNIANTYATKEEIADLPTAANLAQKQDKTDNTLETTSKTVVGAINEVKKQADKGVSDAATAKSAADAAKTAADSKLPTATYNTQVGTVTAGNMGTSASTVVTAIKEVAGEASAAQSTATAAQKTANAAIPAPTAACAEPENKCVLVSSGAGNYSWEVIARNGEGA